LAEDFIMKLNKKANTGAITSIINIVNPDDDLNIRTGFNNKGTIDLKDLTRLKKIVFKDAEFSHFDWLELESIDLNTSDLKNIGIRDNKDLQARLDSFRVSFRRFGYDSAEFPPCMDTDGILLEGRTRIEAAILNREIYMPVAVYTRSDTSVRNTVTNGLRANQKKPTYNATFNDYVVAGVNLISKNELKATSADVDNWLNHEVKAGEVYDNSINGMITKIRKAILKQAETDEELVMYMTKSQAEKWITTNLGLAKADFVLVNMDDNETYAERAWRRVRDALKNDRDPVNLIFYTTANSPSIARAGLKKSMEYIENLYLDSWEVVISQLPQGISLTIPEYRPFIFLGAIPQLVESHNIDGVNLVPVDKY